MRFNSTYFEMHIKRMSVTRILSANNDTFNYCKHYKNAAISAIFLDTIPYVQPDSYYARECKET